MKFHELPNEWQKLIKDLQTRNAAEINGLPLSWQTTLTKLRRQNGKLRIERNEARAELAIARAELALK